MIHFLLDPVLSWRLSSSAIYFSLFLFPQPETMGFRWYGPYLQWPLAVSASLISCTLIRRGDCCRVSFLFSLIYVEEFSLLFSWRIRSCGFSAAPKRQLRSYLRRRHLKESSLPPQPRAAAGLALYFAASGAGNAMYVHLGPFVRFLPTCIVLIKRWERKSVNDFTWLEINKRTVNSFEEIGLCCDGFQVFVGRSASLLQFTRLFGQWSVSSGRRPS